MALHEGSITIARVARLNSSGTDIRYEQLIDGKPEHKPGYLEVAVWGHRQLSIGKTLSTLSYSRWLNVIPLPLHLEDITNVNGVLVRGLGFRPSERSVKKARTAHAARLAAA